MQQRRGTAAQWEAAQTALESTPILDAGEFGLETDTMMVKIGDGINLWGDLAYINGQDNIVVYNGTGSTIPKGSVVYISGAQGQNPSISLADADAELTSSKTLGVTAKAISTGNTGPVAVFGVIVGIDTSAFTAGQALWLSSTAGGLTGTKPTQPAHLVFVGYCIKSHANAGSIFVNPQNGYEVDELHDVLITSKTNNDLLTYESSSGLWKNKSFSTLGLLTSESDTLSTVTGRGATTSSAISITNSTESSSTSTGALTVSGGIGVGGNAYIAGNVVVSGNVTVTGTTSTIQSTTLSVSDKNIELGVPVSPATASNNTANNGGITLKGGLDGDKTFQWLLSTGAWTSSESLNVATGKTYEINGTDIISGTAAALVVGGNSSTSLTLGNASGTTTIAGPASLSSTLTLGSSGNITVNTNKFTVDASNGNTVVAGTLGITGAATFSSDSTLSNAKGLNVNDATQRVGRLIGAGGIVYLQGGLDSADTAGRIILGRTASSSNVSQINLRGDTVTAEGALTVSGVITANGGITGASAKNMTVASLMPSGGTASTGVGVIMTAAATGASAPTKRPNGDNLATGDVWISW